MESCFGESTPVSDQNGSFRPQSSICSVEYKSQHGAGAIYRLEYPNGTWRTLVIISFQIAPFKDTSEVTGLKLAFNEETIGNLYFSPNWIETLWTSSSDELDATVIALSPSAMTIISRTNVARLIVANPKCKETISVFQYIDSKLIISHGSINYINEKYFEYSAVSNALIPGSPIFNNEYNVIGLHSRKGLTPNKWRATRISKILEAFKTELVNQYGGRTENEIWLQRINEIPKELKTNLIGCGGYGKVYMIKEANDNIYAIKLVEGFGSFDCYKSQVHSLEKEYNIVTSLELHPRIIQFFALVKDDINVRLFIVMEYLESGSLLDKIKTGCLDKCSSLKYLGQILEAVNFLHSKSIYHSDIKPANILFTSNDDLKLCDFGIAVHLRTESSATSSHAKGDYFYMSPERINEAPRSAENDIWSVGATFVAMITGHSLNHTDRHPELKIARFDIFIESTPLNEYIQSLNENDYRRVILSRTLCPLENRAKSDELLEMCKNLSSIIKKCEEQPDSNLQTDGFPKISQKSNATNLLMCEYVVHIQHLLMLYTRIYIYCICNRDLQR